MTWIFKLKVIAVGRIPKRRKAGGIVRNLDDENIPESHLQL